MSAAQWTFMVTTRGKRLRAARKTRFRSARAAAFAMGIPVATYGAHERAQLSGGRDFGPEQAKRYARDFGVTPEWLLTGLRPASIETPFEPGLLEESRARTDVQVPVLGYVGAGSQAHYYDLSQGHIDEIEPPRLLGDPIVLEVRDHGLGSQFNNWLVLFDEMRRPVTPDLLGCLCVVAMADGQIVLRQLERGHALETYDLLSESGPDFRGVAVSWAAKVKLIVPP
jgi:hypothetical protein